MKRGGETKNGFVNGPYALPRIFAYHQRKCPRTRSDSLRGKNSGRLTFEVVSSPPRGIFFDELEYPADDEQRHAATAYQRTPPSKSADR